MRRRANHGTQVLRIGHAVQCDKQRSRSNTGGRRIRGSIALAFFSARSASSFSEEYWNGSTFRITPDGCQSGRYDPSPDDRPPACAGRSYQRFSRFREYESSCSIRDMMYSVEEGTPTRSASSTELRPYTRSEVSAEANLSTRRRAARRGSAICRRSAAFLALYAL